MFEKIQGALHVVQWKCSSSQNSNATFIYLMKYTCVYLWCYKAAVKTSPRPPSLFRSLLTALVVLQHTYTRQWLEVVMTGPSAHEPLNTQRIGKLGQARAQYQQWVQVFTGKLRFGTHSFIVLPWLIIDILHVHVHSAVCTVTRHLSPWAKC